MKNLPSTLCRCGGYLFLMGAGAALANHRDVLGVCVALIVGHCFVVASEWFADRKD